MVGGAIVLAVLVVGMPEVAVDDDAVEEDALDADALDAAVVLGSAMSVEVVLEDAPDLVVGVEADSFVLVSSARLPGCKIAKVIPPTMSRINAAPRSVVVFFRGLGSFGIWSGRRESDPRSLLGRQVLYH